MGASAGSIIEWGWATTYLAQTGLLERPSRGVTRITARGQAMLERDPTRIDLGVLSQFPELETFRARHSPDRGSRPQDAPVSVTAPQETGATPEEAIEGAYGELRAAVAEDLRDRIGGRGPAFFEQLVLDVLHAMGTAGAVRGLRRDWVGPETRDSTESSARTSWASTSSMSGLSAGRVRSNGRSYKPSSAPFRARGPRKA